MLKALISMTLVIMSFRTTFSMKGGHNIINPYYKNLPSVVRRNLHVAVISYMEQDCLCANHVQCDTVATILTSEVVLPSYQQFLERTHQTGPTTSSESEILNQYGKTVLMLILARVHGYYLSYCPQSIMEEEQKALYGDVFTHAEKDFLKHRLQTMFPKISREGIETAIVFLEKQKVANCPRVIHTEHRGFDWVVFRRQPDRLPTNYNDEERREDEEDDDYFRVEVVDKDEPNEDSQSNCDTQSSYEDHPDDHSDNPDKPDEDHPNEPVDLNLHLWDQEEVSSQQ